MSNNIAAHKSHGLIKRHTRREELCKNVLARGTHGLRATDVVLLDAFRQAQAAEIRTQVNLAIDVGLITAQQEDGTELPRIRESDNANRITLHITALGTSELTRPADSRPAARMAVITQPRRAQIVGVPNPLDHPPITRPGADDHRQHPSRAGSRATPYTPHP